eukprot:362814-Chlamydomonas_euryale.AAC.3
MSPPLASPPCLENDGTLTLSRMRTVGARRAFRVGAPTRRRGPRQLGPRPAHRARRPSHRALRRNLCMAADRQGPHSRISTP